MIRKISVLLCAGFFLSLASAPSFAQGAGGVFKLDARITLSAFQGLVEDHLAGVRAGLKALAATEEAASGDWERMKSSLTQFSQDLPTDAALWYARPDGSYVTAQATLGGQNLRDRDYFPGLMAGKDVNGDLVISKSTGQRAVIVATPIIKGGQIVGALGASISVEKLAKLVGDRLRLPKNVIFYALDAQGRTALHSEESLMFQFPSDIGDDSLKAAVRTMLTEPAGTQRYTFRGSHRTVIFEKSPATGWVFALGMAQPG